MLRLIPLFFALCTAGCLFDGEGSGCGDVLATMPPTGTFLSERVTPTSRHITPSSQSDADKELVLDRENGTVAVTYIHDGKRVVERWRILRIAEAR